MKNENLSRRDIKHFLDNTYTQEEAKRVFDHLQNEDLKGLIDDCINDAWDESRSLLPDSIAQHSQHKEEAAALLRRIKMSQRFIFRHLNAVSIAASIIIIFTIVFGVYRYNKNKAIEQAYTMTLSTSMGERKTITLPDGTCVTLNACSKIEYPNAFVGKERKVTLIGGAHFKVVHDISKPFIVNTYYNNTNIRVLGTSFNVDAYPHDKIIETTLLEGSIQFEMIKENGQKTKTILKPTEKATYNTKTNSLSVENIDINDEVAWMEGRLLFKNAPIEEVARRLSRVYNVDFKLDGENIKSFSFTGEFTEKSLPQILEYMRISSDIDYEIISKKNNSKKDQIILWSVSPI